MHAGAEIWAHEAGPPDAPLVALVHGSMDRAAGLAKLARRLEHDHRVLRYDRRGYGRSHPHPGPFGIDAQVADLDRLLAGRAAVVFGHSYGGNVALAQAARQSSHVSAVVVYETPLSWLEWWPGSTAGAVAVATVATQGAPEEAAERFMRRLIGDERWERLPGSTRAARRAEGVTMVAELTDLRARPPWEPSAITVPVFALHGERGAAHHRRAMQHVAEVLPHAECLQVAGARHAGPNTHPDAIAAVIRSLAGRSTDQHGLTPRR